MTVSDVISKISFETDIDVVNFDTHKILYHISSTTGANEYNRILDILKDVPVFKISTGCYNCIDIYI